MFSSSPKNLSAFQYNVSVSDQISLLCEPLKYLGLTHFGYLVFFKDGTYLKISNNLDWVRNYLIHNLADKTEAFAETLKPIALNLLDSQLWPPPKVGDCLSALHDFNIWHGINFQIKSEDFIEVFYFATDKENNNIYSVYIEHSDLLKRFIFYFKDKAKDIIDTADRKKLAIQSGIPFFQAATQLTPIANQNINDFLQATTINRYFLNGNYHHIYLTKQEAQCMKYLARGKTTKEIGKLVCISPRTVESYINNIKCKTNLSSTSQILDVFLESNIEYALK